MSEYTRADEILSFEELELTKTKQGIDTKVKKVHKNKVPPNLSPADLDVLIGSYVYTYIHSPNSMSMHQKDVLSALLELKEQRDLVKAITGK